MKSYGDYYSHATGFVIDGRFFKSYRDASAYLQHTFFFDKREADSFLSRLKRQYAEKKMKVLAKEAV